MTIEGAGLMRRSRRFRRRFTSADPLKDAEKLFEADTGGAGMPAPYVLPSFVGGAVEYATYDTVRYLEPEKLTSMCAG